MQVPAGVAYSAQPSMFEAILEECSLKPIPCEQEDLLEELDPLPIQELFREQKPEPGQNAWFWLGEAPEEDIIEQTPPNRQDLTLEFRRVKSLREEQQTKIAQFLRDDKFKSLRCLQPPSQHDSPTNKYSQSLSPRKRKRIDKSRPLKLTHQDD